MCLLHLSSVARRFGPAFLASWLLMTPHATIAGSRSSPEDDAADRDCRSTLRARQALQKDTVLAPLALGVSVRSGAAIVWGAVPSTEVRRRAEERIRQAPGILSVRNELQILPPDDPLAEFLTRPATPLPVPLPAVPEALKAPATLTSRWADGAAELTGSSPTLKEKNPGVSLLPPLALPGGSTDLTATVEHLRAGDPRFRDVRIEVAAGVVRLLGFVPHVEDGMELAGKIARLPGVERVSVRDLRSSADR